MYIENLVVIHAIKYQVILVITVLNVHLMIAKTVLKLKEYSKIEIAKLLTYSSPSANVIDIFLECHVIEFIK